MKIAITGAKGFMGTELTKLLDKENLKWIGLSRTDNIDPYIATDYSVKSLINILSSVDVVVHLAAIRCGDNANGYQNYSENEILTENLLRAMEQSTPKRIIFLSSISVYSDLSLLPWNEDIRPKPTSFYGLSKLVCEYLCERYQNKGIKNVIFRCAHVLGLENKGYMLSKFLNGAANKETLIVKGKSIAKREFIYVKDVARGIVWAIKNKDISGIYNLGTGIGYTNYEMANMINKCFENTGNINYIDNMEEGIASSYMNVTKLSNSGFDPIYTVSASIRDIKRDKFEGNSNV